MKQKPKLKLTGQDGNAFMVLALAKKAAKKAGWNQLEIDNYLKKATSGDYDHLLHTTMVYFDVE